MSRVRRGLLFMPGDDRRKIEKGAALEVDSVIMDLEDGVALNNKPAARETILAALREVEFGKRERLVRVNPASSPFHREDLAGTIDGQPDGYVLPKTESAEALRALDAWLAAAERKRGWVVGKIRLLALVETALGVVNLREIAAIASESERLVALIFGAEDLAGDMGAIRSTEGTEVFYAKSAVVLHAKAYGLQAIDTPFVRLDDEPGLITETTQALRMGYTGKLAIHPKQVAPIQAAFTPSAEEIARAQALVEAHEAHQAAGAGVFAYEGRMIDMPMVRAAEAVLERARVAGLLEGR